MRRFMIVIAVGLLLAVAVPAGAGGPGDLPEPVEMRGVTTFFAYAPMLGEWVTPADNVCETDATLAPDGRKRALLTTNECAGYRIATWDVKLTPGGAVKMSLPGGAEEMALIEEHTGCDLNGTPPVYHGSFDGTRLAADMHFHSVCDGGTMWGPYFGISEAMGPLYVTFGVDLTLRGE